MREHHIFSYIHLIKSIVSVLDKNIYENVRVEITYETAF